MEWLYSLWQNVLYSLGLVSVQRTILFLGLDNAGKTTLMHKLKHGAVRHFVPTERALCEELVVGKLTMKAWDLGGHDQVRRLWRDYFAVCDAVVFLVDACDRDRFAESKNELAYLRNNEQLGDVPFVILANKCDMQHAAHVDELLSRLGLGPQDFADKSSGKRPLQMFRVSIVDGWGYPEAFKWLSDNV